jgi:hypothetical protein
MKVIIKAEAPTAAFVASDTKDIIFFLQRQTPSNIYISYLIHSKMAFSSKGCAAGREAPLDESLLHSPQRIVVLLFFKSTHF